MRVWSHGEVEIDCVPCVACITVVTVAGARFPSMAESQPNPHAGFRWPFPASAKRMFRRWLRRRQVGQAVEPVSRIFGIDWGTPVDRRYIERFLEAHASDIRGEVLEIADSSYTTRFGNSSVVRSHVLSLDAAAPGVTIVADLAGDARMLPQASLDCVLCTQTLQFIRDVPAAIANMHAMLKPGGVLLLTVPGITQIARWDLEQWGERWRFTSMAIRELLGEHFEAEQTTVESFGNVRSATAFLYGLPAEDLRANEVDHHDRDYELIIAARAVRSG